MSLPSRVAELITHHSVIVIAILLLTTGVFGVGITHLDDDSSLDQFESDSPEAEAAAYIQSNFSVEEADNTTGLQLIARGDNVLTKASLIDSLELQQHLHADPTIESTLAADSPIVGVENLVAIAAIGQTAPAASQPTLEEQIQAIEALESDQFEAILTSVLSTEGEQASAALGLMPTSYDPGSTTAEARMITISQAGGDADPETGFDQAVLDSQLDIRDVAAEQEQEYLVFGAGIIFQELDQSMGDSLAIVGPIALLFVVLALTVAYRDFVDIFLGILGIVAVLVWTFGAMGWLGMAFNQMMVAVPVLLIGLSIDYAIHVFMRHREQRSAENGAETPRRSMSIALAGVGIALLWVTATMAIGFLANLVSPIGALGDFGIASAIGIVSALIVFGALIPAIKIHLDSALERIGFDRRKRAFGTGGGRFSSVLKGGVTAARRAPTLTIVVVLLLTTGGLVGATQIDTSFDEEDFISGEPPGWTDYLPGFMAPGEYSASASLEYVNEQFQRDDYQADLLIRGDLTDPATLREIHELQDEAAGSDIVFQSAAGEPQIRSPVLLMQQVAADNEDFAATLDEHDTTGDRVPDRDLATVYDHLFAVAPQAAELIHRADDGSPEALRMVYSIRGDAEFDATTEEMRSFASTLETRGDGQWDVIATGDPVVSHVVEGDLLNTVIQTLLLTLGAVFVFLTVAYWLTGNTISLGLVTLAPVVIAVSWILGSMALLDIPFNVLTGMITSLTIGLGIAYSIHISSRYTLELDRQEDVWGALETTVTGTGGALLGSAATTVGAFGTLSLATFPVLQQFGLVTGLTIVYAFLASVFVLPTLLVLWTRLHRPEALGSATETTINRDSADGR